MMRPYKHLKCHWCLQELLVSREPSHKENTYFIECKDCHCGITLNSKGKHIRDYYLFYDVQLDKDKIASISNTGGMDRYKIQASEMGQYTEMSIRRASSEYKLVARLAYIPLKIENDIIKIEYFIKRIKLLSILS